MPDTDHFTGLPVPLVGETSSGPNDFSAFRTALGGHTVLYATTSANRDSLYGTASVPTGTLCVSTSSETVWQKTDSGWNAIYYDSGVVSLAAMSYGADWQDNGSSYRIIGSQCYLDLRATYTGSDILATAAGNISPDESVGTLPSAAIPLSSHVPGTADWDSTPAFIELLGPSGGITIRYGVDNKTYSAGSDLNWAPSYLVSPPA